MEGSLPQDHRIDFDPYLFNLPGNLPLQAHSGWHTFFAARTDRKLIRAYCHFHIDGTVATSPRQNPFGSFEFADAFTPKELFSFIRYVEDTLREKGVKNISIKSYPQSYHSARSSLLYSFLVNNGFMVKEAEVSACIEIRTSNLVETLSSWEKRKLRQQKQTDLRFRKIPIERIREVYDFILSCRKEREQSLSLTIGQLGAVIKTFPENFVLFGIFEKESLAAASVSVRINKSILYNFYSAHARPYDTLSPVVGLIEGMYSFCQHEGIRLLDLGTSSLRSKPNFSLLDFKLNLGATPTPKFTFTKEL